MDLIDYYNYRVVLQYLPEILKGLWATLWISFFCLFMSLVIGAFAVTARNSNNKILSFSVRAYIDVIRSTPLLVQVYIAYYGLTQLPILNINVSPIVCGIVALSLHTGAYMSEIIRAGIEAIDRGQWEAAKAVGMNKRQTMINVIYPQAFSKILPAMLGQAAVLMKDSSILSFIAVPELLGAGMLILSERVMPTEAFMTPAIGYLLIYLMMLFLSTWVQRKLGGQN